MKTCGYSCECPPGSRGPLIDTDATLLPLFDESDGSCETGYCWT